MIQRPASALFLVLFAACPGAARAGAPPPDVTTLAGTGASGIADGPAQEATFLFPSGIAVARDGSIYISDRDGQRIRVLTRAGQVRTLAGSGAIQPPGFGVAPGYRDGAARVAQFNAPGGLAIGPDGALYIADSGNACIRKLQHGQVSTALGKCGDSEAVDGVAATARLKNPKDVAFDAAGTMYIADDGVGLRKFGSDGVLVTLHFKTYYGTSALGVTVANSADSLVLVTSIDGIVAYHPTTGADDGFGLGSPDEGGFPFTTPNRIAVIDRRQYVVTDLLSHNIRYFRFPAPLFVGNMSTRVVAGGEMERPIDNAGFANGKRDIARFYEPMGVARIGNRIIVADGGNRRIRQIVLPHVRVSEAGLDPANRVDEKHYEVALIGASWSFADSLGDDSICGHIESILDRSHRFHKPVRCHTVTIDGSPTGPIEDYIKNVFPYERMDLVIMDAESWTYYHAPHDVLPGGGTYADLFRSRMQQLFDVLAPLRTKLALVWVYPIMSVSDSEWIITRPPGTFRAPPDSSSHDLAAQMQTALHGMPILQYDIYGDMLEYQLRSGALPLYHATDQHPNPLGNAFIGDHFAQGLLNAGLRP